MLYRRFTIISMTLLGTALLASLLLNEHYRKTEYYPLFYTSVTERTSGDNHTSLPQANIRHLSFG